MARKRKKKGEQVIKKPVDSATPKEPTPFPSPFRSPSLLGSEPTPHQTVVVEFSEMVYLRAIFFLAIILGTLFLTYYLRSILTPIMFAWLMAYLFHPVVKRIEQMGASQNFAISLVMIFLGVFALVLMIVLIPALSRSIAQVSELFGRLPDLVHSLKVWVEKQFQTQVPSTWTEVFTVWGAQLKAFAPKAIQTISQMVASIFSSGMDLLIGIFHILLVPLFMYYFLYEFEYIKKKVPTFIPPRYSDWVSVRFKHIDQVLSGYIRGQLIVCLIVGSLYLLILVPLKIPGAPMIALLGGMFNVIPYVGFLSIYFVTLLVTLLEYQLNWPFFVVFVGMMCVHMSDIFFLTPKVVGEQLGVSELVVILAVLLGGHLFGMIGVLIAVPMAAVGKVAMEEMLQRYRQSEFFLREKVQPESKS